MKRGITIGLIDSGVDLNQCGLNDAVVAYHCIHTQKSHGTSDHGTFNAALLCGYSPDTSIKAIIPDSKLYVCEAIEGLHLAQNILEALEWMLEQSIQILLMPFGMKGNSPLFSSFIQRFVDKGVLPIAAIGNEGAGKYRAPGFYNNVLSVGAINAEEAVAPFSGSYNNKKAECLKPDVATLGVDIESPFTKIGKQSGTSMAATILAGQAAQLWSAFPYATCLEIYNAIIHGAAPVKPDQEHRCKYGIFNFEKAEQCLREGTTSRKYQLVQESFTKYVDPYLFQESKYAPNNKLFEFVIILTEGVSNNYLETVFPNVEVLKKFNFSTIFLVRGNNEVIECLNQDVRVKLIQSVEVPFFSFD